MQYYKQLQSISDSLKEAEWNGPVDEAITESNALQAELDGKIKSGKARERYVRWLHRALLTHLTRSRIAPASN